MPRAAGIAQQRKLGRPTQSLATFCAGPGTCPQKVKDDKVRYSGSILKYSKSETPHQKQTSIVTIEKDKLEIEPLRIKPLRDMRTIRSTFSELMKGQSEDYLFFELEDTEYVLDAMNQLRRRYPHAMGLEYVSRRETESVALQHNREDLQQLSYLDLFKDFYEQYRAIEMEESGQKIVADIFSALGRKD